MRSSWARGLILSFVCFGCANYGNYRPHLNAEAMFIERAIDALSLKNPDVFREQVMRKPKTVLDTNLYPIATNAFPTVFGYAGEDFQIWPTGLDVWDTPFFIDIRLTKRVTETPGKIVDFFEMRMWSAGPNRKDDSGGGDDIVFGPFQLEVR